MFHVNESPRVSDDGNIEPITELITHNQSSAYNTMFGK